jgi:hypothetical protein
MTRSKILQTTMMFWILLIILSAAWLIYILFNNLHLVTENILILAVVIISILSFCLSFFFIYLIITDMRIEIKKAKEAEKNVKDVYQYDQLLDPPIMYT